MLRIHGKEKYLIVDSASFHQQNTQYRRIIYFVGFTWYLKCVPKSIVSTYIIDQKEIDLFSPFQKLCSHFRRKIVSTN